MKVRLKFLLVILFCSLLLHAVSGSEESGFTVQTSQDTAQIGDIVKIKSTIPLKNSGCIYLFMTGPNLPEEGVPIEGDIRHAKIPYDKIYLSGVVFEKEWDTGLIIGGLEGGEYTIYISTIKQNAINPETGTYATSKITITDPKNSKKTETPLYLTCVFGSLIAAGLYLKKKNYQKI